MIKFSHITWRINLQLCLVITNFNHGTKMVKKQRYTVTAQNLGA
jgi:hypothetical protein